MPILSPLFLEGVYDPLFGDMHLIACRKVADRRTSVEGGLDCLVEAKVQYPSETGRWLKNPSVEITITIQRNEDDPLHFNTVTLQTYTVPYHKHHHDVASRKLFEWVLRVLISSLLVGIIFSQLSYMNEKVEYIPYISLGMLAEQILGYGAELLRDTEILFRTKESEFFREWSQDLDEHKLLMEALTYTARVLVVAALFLTARLYQKVSESKSRPNPYGSNKPKRLPHNKHVLLRNLKIHIVVSLILLGLVATELFLRNDFRMMDAYLLLPALLIRRVQIHVLWAQDFFLLPQVLENSLWQTQVKPLRKTYYIGLTLLGLFLYFYDYIRDPILDPYIDNDGFNQVGSDVFSISGISGIIVSIVMIVLAAIVHIQQSWNHLKSARR